MESYPCVPIRFIQSALWADCPIFDIRLDDPKDCYAWPRGADKRARSCQVRAAHRFSADERRLDRLGIELI